MVKKPKTRVICGITFAAMPCPADAEWRAVWHHDQYDITIKVPVGGGWTVIRAPGRNIVSTAPAEKALAEVLHDVACDYAKVAPLIQHAAAWVAAQDEETKCPSRSASSGSSPSHPHRLG